METLNIDIETYSDEDLPNVGVYKYTDSPNFEILLFAYAIDHGKVTCVDLTENELPEDLLVALTDPEVIKIAFNAQFERVALTHYLRRLNRLEKDQWLDARQWHDTMVEANELGLPASLKQAAAYLGVPQQKDTRGVRLINFFSKPAKPTKANNMRKRNLPEDAPEDWQTFIDYNIQDVRTEMAIADKLKRFPMKSSEWALWAMDQRINDRGVAIDVPLADGAVQLMESQNDNNLTQLKAITGLENPNSLKQFKSWLANNGHPFDKLGKALVQDALAKKDLPDNISQALQLRLKLSNASTKKYLKMENARCSDGRVHGLLQFYGANRTGRWAGRLLQVQNLPRNYIGELDTARQLVKSQDGEAIEWFYDSIPEVLKQLIRTALIPKPGHRLIVCDFSAIEARVIAWYAHEKWTLEAFRTHGKIYEATASQMFNIPLKEVDKPTRQKGKVATLALGYQGSTGALEAMGALKMGITEDELPELVEKWRKANSHIVQFWYDTEKAAKAALSDGGVQVLQKGLKFYKKGGFLFIQLPSGRKLAYAKARLEEGTYGPQMVYEGQGDRVGFTKLHTYGGKLVENIVQATARDLLAEAMYRLEQHSYRVIFHIHDEAVTEMPEGVGSVAEMRDIMCEPVSWAKDLPLNAAGFESSYYMKD
ncbi:DNA polymerase [Agrilactobacillus fermenti]|uniref:DNA polymerase n=1 Tax=Agrilactobacillus fermenti TaxID=2586909 RepID=UPI003A5C12DC